MTIRSALGRARATLVARATARRWLPPGVAAWALAAAVGVLLILRGMAVMSPLIAGDAYAYFAHSRMAGRFAELYAADPWMQQINNPLFFALGGLSCRMAGGDGTLILRVLHAVLFVGGGGLLAWMIWPAAYPRVRVATLGILLATPLSSYCLCFMPETLYFFLVVILSVVLARAPAPIGGGAAVGAGLVLGALACTKPHAAAVAVAVALFIVVEHVRDRGVRGLVSACGAVVAVAVGAAVAWIAINRGFYGALQADARQAVGGIYSTVLARMFSTGLSVSQCGVVLLRHLLVNASAFAVPLLLMARWVFEETRQPFGRPGGREHTRVVWRLVVWSLAVFVCAVAMSVVFTAREGQTNPAEALRVHGRYYGFAVPIVLAAWVAAYPQISVRSWFPGWAAAAAGLAAACGFGTAACDPGRLTIYPWDYPELLGLSRWVCLGWPVAVLPWVLAGVIAMAAVLIAIRPGWTLWTVGTTMLCLFVAGHYNVWRWQSASVADQGLITMEARAVATLLPPSSRDRGLVVGAHRYGTMAFALYGLMANNRVLHRPELSVLTRRDLPADVEWILTTDPIAVDMPCSAVIAGQKTTFFRLLPFASGEAGDPIVISAADGSEPVAFVGFNAAEQRCRWSALPVASLMLPRHVAGAVTVRMRCYAARPDPQQLVFTLGSGTATLPVDGTSRLHEFEIDAGAGGAVVTLRGIEPLRANPWAPPRGVALERLEIEPRQPDRGGSEGRGTVP